MTTSAGDLGPFTGLRLMHATPTVELFTGFERNGRRPVVLIALTEQAGRDPNWSAEFTDAVAKDATTLGPLDVPVHVSDLYGRRPWAASLIAPGRRGAERILAALPGVVPEGTDPSALLHRPPQAGPPPYGQPHGGPQQARPQAPAPFAPAGGNAPAQRQQGFAQPSAPPAQVSAPGYHPAPGPPDHETSADTDISAAKSAPPAQAAQSTPISGPTAAFPTSPPDDAQLTEPIPAVAPPGSPAVSSSASAEGTPSASPAGNPQATGSPALAGSSAPGSPGAQPGTPSAQPGPGTPGAQQGNPGAQPGSPGTQPGPGSPGTQPGPGSPGAQPGPGSPGTQPGPGSPGTQPGPGSPGAQPGPGTPGGQPGTPGAQAGPGAPGTQAGHGSLGSNAGMGTPGGQVGRTGDEARAEGAPKLGPLPPGARNPTVPTPHTPLPTSGPGGGRPGGQGGPSGQGGPGHGGPGGPNPGGPGQGGPNPGGPGQGGFNQQGQRPQGPGAPGGPIGGNTGSFPRPQGLPPQQPPPKSRGGLRAVVLVLVAVLCVGVLAVCAGSVFFLAAGQDDDKSASSDAKAPGAGAPPAPSRNAEKPAPDAPAYKKALPVIVTGAVFDSGEQTDLIQREGWPFAFRVPVGWLCDQTMVVEGTGSDGLECRPPGRANEAAVRIGVRDCDQPCSRETQQMLNGNIAPGTLIEGDATTGYAELANAKDNVYSLFMSHFFGSGPGQELRWQVVVQGSSPHTDRAAIQKVANDIRTQTP